MKVYSSLGPGLLEQPYKKCLQHELTSRGFTVNHEVYLPVLYDSVLIDIGYRLDLLVNSEVIIEVKAVQTILPVHRAQMLTYLKLARKHVGLLINFNVVHLKGGLSASSSDYSHRGGPLRSSESSVVPTQRRKTAR